MRKIFQLILILIFLTPTVFAANQPEKISDVITNGKWVDYSKGYVPIPTYKAGEENQKENPKTVKRFKTLTFEKDGAFVLDSAKQRYSGHYTTIGNSISLNFNRVAVTQLRINTDPNNSGGYNTTTEMVKLPARVLSISDEGVLLGDGSRYKNYSGAMSGLFIFTNFRVLQISPGEI